MYWQPLLKHMLTLKSLIIWPALKRCVIFNLRKPQSCRRKITHSLLFVILFCFVLCCFVLVWPFCLGKVFHKWNLEFDQGLTEINLAANPKVTIPLWFSEVYSGEIEGLTEYFFASIFPKIHIFFSHFNTWEHCPKHTAPRAAFPYKWWRARRNTLRGYSLQLMPTFGL